MRKCKKWTGPNHTSQHARAAPVYKIDLVSVLLGILLNICAIYPYYKPAIMVHDDRSLLLTTDIHSHMYQCSIIYLPNT